nr:hypothetical protein Iba_scaffold1225086CG0010 [Ipomoea batatas]
MAGRSWEREPESISSSNQRSRAGAWGSGEVWSQRVRATLRANVHQTSQTGQTATGDSNGAEAMYLSEVVCHQQDSKKEPDYASVMSFAPVVVAELLIFQLVDEELHSFASWRSGKKTASTLVP